MSQGILQEELFEEEIDPNQYLVFSVESQEYGFQVTKVSEISTVLPTTKVPNAPSFIEGIMNLRGRLATVICFHKKLGFEPKDSDEDTRVIILEHGGFPIGVIVDSVEEVIRIPETCVQKVPEVDTTSVSEEFISGVGLLDERLIILLDAVGFLTKAEWIEAGAIAEVMDKARKDQEATENTEVVIPDTEKGERIVKREQSKQEKIKDAKPQTTLASGKGKRGTKTRQKRQGGAEVAEAIDAPVAKNTKTGAKRKKIKQEG